MRIHTRRSQIFQLICRLTLDLVVLMILKKKKISKTRKKNKNRKEDEKKKKKNDDFEALGNLKTTRIDALFLFIIKKYLAYICIIIYVYMHIYIGTHIYSCIYRTKGNFMYGIIYTTYKRAIHGLGFKELNRIYRVFNSPTQFIFIYYCFSTSLQISELKIQVMCI